MAFIHRKLCKTLSGKQAYASNRSFLQFLNDSLQDIGISTLENLPLFKDKNEESTVKELLLMWDHLYKMRDLAYNIKAHQSILDRAKNEKNDIPQEELRFHQDYVNKKQPRVQEYYSVTETPVEIIEQKFCF